MCRVDVSAIEIDDGSICVINGKDDAVVEDFVAFGIEDAEIFQRLDDGRIFGQDLFQAAVDKARAEVGAASGCL
jgi:hypothetical protein